MDLIDLRRYLMCILIIVVSALMTLPTQPAAAVSGECQRLLALIPTNPIQAARRNVRQASGPLFAVSGTDMGHSEVWGLGRIDGTSKSEWLRQLVLKHGSVEYPVIDTCMDATHRYETALGAYNREVVRILQQPSASLVEAKLSKVEDISAQPNAPRICLDDKCEMTIDGSFRTTFTVTRRLLGPRIPSTVSLMQASAQPRIGLRYYLVVTSSHDGSRIEWAGLAEHGLCLGSEEADRLGMRAALDDFTCKAE